MDSQAAVPATVYIVDDNPAVRDAIRWLVEEVGLCAKVFTNAQDFLADFDNDMEADKHADAESVGCLVLDIRMPGMSGLELQDLLVEKNIGLPVIVVTGHGDVPMAVRSMKTGAFEFLQKPFNDQSLLDTIYAAIKRHQAIVDESRQRAEAASNLARLTRREKQVLSLIRAGESSKEIAAQLHISVRTVEGHRAKLMEKTQSHTVAQLLEVAHVAEFS